MGGGRGGGTLGVPILPVLPSPPPPPLLRPLPPPLGPVGGPIAPPGVVVMGREVLGSAVRGATMGGDIAIVVSTLPPIGGVGE